MAQLVIYTDLDGTLLDAETYSAEAARPALEAIARHRALLVLCSSKTRAEIESVQEELGLHVPFIVENGGAIYLPRRQLAALVPEVQDLSELMRASEAFPHADLAGTLEVEGSWLRLALGMPHAQVRAGLREIARRVGVDLVGLSDLTPEQVSRETGLSLEAARRAQQREYDEPFRLARSRDALHNAKNCVETPEDPALIAQIEALAAKRGLRLTRGGRYFHLTGPTDKGRAVRLLTAILERRFGAIVTVGIGDSVNDVPLLREVAFPVLVRRPSGEPDPDAVREIPRARITRGIGPVGWAEAVLEILSRMETAR